MGTEVHLKDEVFLDLERELGVTRKVLGAVPEGKVDPRGCSHH